MAADGGDVATFGLPDLFGLSEAERLQVLAVMQKARDFEDQEKAKSTRPRMEGQLLKYTNVMKGWQTRWFVLDPESGMLEYFEKEEHKKQRPRGSVHLAAAIISPSDEDSQTFTVAAATGEAFKLRGSDARERQHWVDRLRSTAEYHTANIAQNPEAYRRGDSGQSNRDTGTPRRMTQKGLYSSEESVHTLVGSREGKRHTTPSPFIEVQEYLTEARGFSLQLSEKIASLPFTGDNCFMTGLDKDLLILKATSGATLLCIQECLNLLQGSQVQSTMPHSTSVPGNLSSKRTSPGSSSLPAYAKLAQANHLPEDADTLHSFTTESCTSTKSMGAVSMIPAEEEVTDQEKYKDSELGATDEHKSVILHLLSQLKLGMDLTKVVLPTFILERRSLLEMFADCMAHPDIFLSITDNKSPEQRMMMVLEWYLTSFHASREGSVAKKPYNPIIGETFHCSWLIPQNEDGTIMLNTSGDPEVKTGFQRLVFHAEQVSHHPPVSAFYFECPDKRVCLNGSVWTKSKFMGMSIGVVMVGKVTLKLLEHGEEYVFGLPSAYARSILTVPWVELGDKITLSCEKTNLTAQIVFHTKPFYGGKLHRVSAEVKNTATNASLCKVSGEWNDKFEFSYADGTQKIVDTSKLTVWRKRVRPVAKQADFESRRLWQHVTNALAIGDVNTATEHKRLLEERQREGERHRKELGTKFSTKMFHEEGDSWLYNCSLSSTDVRPGSEGRDGLQK